MSNMNQFYQKIDHAIKQGLSSTDLTFLLEFPQAELPNGTLFDLPTNSQYLLKRFINACMSTDPDVREHSAEALTKWFKLSQVQPNLQKVIKFTLDVSNYKKGGNRKSQSQASAAGRILVVKALNQFFKNNSQVYQSLSQIISDFPHLQIEAIEACHLISFDKILKLKFHSISPQNKSSRFLYKLFLKTKDPKSQPVKIEELPQILEIQAENYPKKSIVLYNVGKYFNTITDVPMEFFRQYANKYLDNDIESDVDVHQMYAILTILKGFLQTNTITQQNYKTHFDKKIISVWLQQFRVLNKKMKSLAQSMAITFEEGNKILAYQTLVDLHEEGVYLDNISMNHPLAKLYQWVDTGAYWEYIYNLCVSNDVSPIEQEGVQQKRVIMESQKKKKKQSKKKQQKNQNEQTNEQQDQLQQEPETFYNQLQHFIKLRYKQLSEEHLCKTIILLLNKYHKNEQMKQILFLCINLFNLICKIPKKKKINAKKQGKINKNMRLNKKMLIVLNKLELSELQSLSEEQISTFKKCILWGKKNTMKIRKQQNYQAPQQQIDFFNFYHAMIFFCLIYPDEIQTCSELQMVYQDLINFYTNKSTQAVSQPKKKVKKQKKAQDQGDQKSKPIHVLTDIFISLMTKPPVFLRKAVHNLYEDIIPHLDKTDIANMLTVITTPDAQFIEEI